MNPSSTFYDLSSSITTLFVSAATASPVVFLAVNVVQLGVAR